MCWWLQDKSLHLHHEKRNLMLYWYNFQGYLKTGSCLKIFFLMMKKGAINFSFAGNKSLPEKKKKVKEENPADDIIFPVKLLLSYMILFSLMS